MARFDWNDLTAFLAVARTGRLTAAAARLGLDHSTLSRRVAGLEHALKAKLFDRSPAGYTLTEAGSRLMRTAEQMERLALGAEEQVGGTAASVAGDVRIGAPGGFGSWFLAPRLATLRAAYPDLRVQLVAASSAFSLAKRDVDMAITVSRPPTGRLNVARLVDYDLALYAAPAYLAAHPPIHAAADLGGHRFVSYIEDLLHFPELDFLRHLAPEGGTALETSNIFAQFFATRAGAGLCVLPGFLAGAEPGLVRVLAEEVKLTRSLWLVVHQDQAELARVRAVSRFVREAVERERTLFALA
ncbi:MAG: LysR family transcriptional regulator [Allosphingosinicella sp.]